MKSLFLSVAFLSLLGTGVGLGLDIDPKVSQSFGASFVPVKGHSVQVVNVADLKTDPKTGWSVTLDENGEALLKDLKPGDYRCQIENASTLTTPRSYVRVPADGSKSVLISARGTPKTNPKTLKKDPALGFEIIRLSAQLSLAAPSSAAAGSTKPVVDGPAVGVEVTAKMGAKELKATTGKDGVAVIDGVEPTSVVFTASGREKTLNLSKLLRKAGKVQVKVTLKGGVADLVVTPVR